MHSDRRPKIAFVSTLKSAPWGGSEELWHLAALASLERGHSVSVFVYEWPEDAEKIRRLSSMGAVVDRRRRSPHLLMRLLEKLYRRLGVAPAELFNPFKSLRGFDPDLVVVTDGAVYYTAEDRWLSNTLLSHFKGRYVILSQGNSPYHMPSDRAHARRLFEHARRVLFVSEGNRRQAFHQLASVVPNSEVIQNPIRESFKEPLPMPPFEEGVVRCAMVGRLAVSDKGQDMVLALLAAEHWRHVPFHMHIYGSGADEGYLRALIEYYGLSDRVSLEGYSDPVEIWSKCNCLVMPSNVEGTPLTLLEAMSAGRLCIATDVGGNAEWIEDGINGYLVDAPTVKLLDAKMRQAFSEKDEWPRLAANARGTIEAKAVFDQASRILEFL